MERQQLGLGGRPAFFRVAAEFAAGRICRGRCPADRDKCGNAPSANQPWECECPACDGLGCEHCGDSGIARLTACPQTIVPAEIWECRRLAEFAEKGLLPLAGGVLDQTDAFLAGCRVVWRERDRIRNEDRPRG